MRSSLRLVFCIFAIAGILPAQTTLLVSELPTGLPADGASFEGAISSDGSTVAFSTEAQGLGGAGFRQVWARRLPDGPLFLVSASVSGLPGNGLSEGPALSADGRYVAFESFATDLIPGDSDTLVDVFVRDTVLGTTQKASVGPGNVASDGHSFWCSISAEGRYVLFESRATTLVSGFGSASFPQVYRKDLATGALDAVSVTLTGGTPGAACQYSALSADGRYAVFGSGASNLIAGDTNGKVDVFRRDILAGTTVRVPSGLQGEEPDDGSARPSLSQDGSFVAYLSSASNLVAGDTNGALDVFITEVATGTTSRANVSSIGGLQTQGVENFIPPAISADGRRVVFASTSPELVPGETGFFQDIFMHDRIGGSTLRVSNAYVGSQGNSDSPEPGFGSSATFLLSGRPIGMSGDARFVVFPSVAWNLVVGDSNGVRDIFVRDLGCDVVFTTFGQGTPGTGGITPVLTGLEAPCSGGSAVVIALARGGASGVLAVSTTLPFVPMPFLGGQILVGLDTVILVPFELSGPSGFAGAGYAVFFQGDVSAYHGITLYEQALILDSVGNGGGCLTNGLIVSL
jgi:Tol biopolymer transport system component